MTRQLQQLDYEAQQAFELHNHVDPSNRLVAEALEHRWEEKLRALETLKGELDTLGETTPSLGETEKAMLLALGENFSTAWNDPACSMVLKKQIARALIHAIMVITLRRNPSSFTTVHQTNLATAVTIQGKKVWMTEKPDDLVFGTVIR